MSRRDVALACAIGLMGFLFNSRQFILFLNSVSAYQGFVIYYTILYGALFGLSKLDLLSFNPRVSNIRGTAGVLLLWFGFSVTVNWENPFVQYITTGSFEGASSVFFQAEDGVLWAFVTQFLRITDIGQAWILTFVVLPILIALAGLALVGGKVKVEV